MPLVYWTMAPGAGQAARQPGSAQCMHWSLRISHCSAPSSSCSWNLIRFQKFAVDRRAASGRCPSAPWSPAAGRSTPGTPPRRPCSRCRSRCRCTWQTVGVAARRTPVRRRRIAQTGMRRGSALDSRAVAWSVMASDLRPSPASPGSPCTPAQGVRVDDRRRHEVGERARAARRVPRKPQWIGNPI